MGECNTNSFNYNFTPIMHTTDSIQWVGDAVECLDVCSGARLTELEAAILEKLCSLVNTVDLDSVVIPTCLTTAWGTKDKDLLTFINFLLDQNCVQQTQIDTNTSNIVSIDPVFTIEYTCCDDSCIPGTTLKLSQHLEKILLCLCDVKSIALDAQSKAENALIKASSANTVANQAALTAVTASENVTDTYAVLKAKINCIIEASGIASTCPLL